LGGKELKNERMKNEKIKELKKLPGTFGLVVFENGLLTFILFRHSPLFQKIS
jgi:hypothetical protein